MDIEMVNTTEVLNRSIAPVVAEAQAMVITCTEQAEAANERRKVIKELMGKVKVTFGEPKKKAHEVWKMLVGRETEYLAPLEKAYEAIGIKLGAYVQAEEAARRVLQQRLEDEAQKRQTAELARIEKKTAALLEKAGDTNEQIETLQAALDSPETTDGEAASLRAKLSILIAQRDKAAAELEAQAAKVEQAAAAPVPVCAPAPKIAGLSTRTVKKGAVTNKAQIVMAVASGSLPMELLDVNQTALNKLVSAGAIVPGVTVREERVVATR